MNISAKMKVSASKSATSPSPKTLPASGGTRQKSSEIKNLITLDEKNGKFYYDGNFIPSKFGGAGHSVGNNTYSNFSIKTTADNKICNVTAYYKNGSLDNISIFLDNDYLKNNYSPPADLDFRDYLTPFIEYSINELKIIVKSFLNSNKTKFSWGRLEILTDPRDQGTFICIRYNRVDWT